MFLHCSGTAIFFHQDLNFCLLMLGSIWVLTWISFVWSSDWGTSLGVSALATVLRITSTTCTWIHTDTTVFILLFFQNMFTIIYGCGFDVQSSTWMKSEQERLMESSRTKTLRQMHCTLFFWSWFCWTRWLAITLELSGLSADLEKI